MESGRRADGQNRPRRQLTRAGGDSFSRDSLHIMDEKLAIALLA